MASGFRRAMDASNRLDFGLDSGTNINGFDYVGDGMDRGLPDFPIQFPGTLTVGGNVSSVCTTTDVFAWPLSYGGPLLGSRAPPGTHVNFEELERQKDSREQRSTAMLWTNVCKEIQNLLKVIPCKLRASQSPEEIKEIVVLLSERWKALEELHMKYLPGINERKRLEEVQNRYSNLKRGAHDVINECEGFLQNLGSSPGNLGMDPGLPDQDVERDDNVSVYSKSSSASGSSRKKSLKRALVSKMKLDLARARANEEAEAARIELKRLEEEASLAELEWKIETEYNDEGGLTAGAASPLDATTFLVDKRPHSTPVTSDKIEASRSDASPGTTSVTGKETVSQLNPCTETSATPVSGILKSRDSMKTQLKSSFSRMESNVPKTLDSVKSPQSFRVPSVQQSQRATCGDHAPRDPVAAMWKAQMLSGMQPTRFSGNPVDFPFFRDQMRTHLESDLICDAQRV